MECTILTIGDEILIGQIIDTNSAWLAQQLNAIGFKIREVISLADNEAQIKSGLKRAASQSSLVIITGGLGPTKDDITMKTLCKYFHTKAVFHAPTFEKLKVIFEKRGKEILDINRKQAMLPADCTVLENSKGTAPGMWFEQNNCVFVSLPGVPFEMKNLFKEQVLNRLKNHFSLPEIVHLNLMLAGVGESTIAHLLTDFENNLPEFIRLAYLPDLGILKLRLSLYENSKVNNEVLQVKFRELKSLLKKYSYAEKDQKLEEYIAELFLSKKKKLALAESCTGGYVAHLLTSVPGSSGYFEGSMVTYSNEMKIKQLQVSKDTLNTLGAVSEACVREMLLGVFANTNADYGIAISGIAGPDGGSAEKPVGTVCFAIGNRKRISTKTLQLLPSRAENIRASAIAALNLLRIFVLEND